jgi:deazaflavin-dependent oxidoreductase (nitroreductase family)
MGRTIELSDREAHGPPVDQPGQAAGIPYGKPKPRGLLRRMLQVPPLLYRTRLARHLGPRLLALTTIGRRTGQERTVGLNYARDGETVYVLSGYGRTDWYRNLVADPHVKVQIGSDHWSTEATAVSDSVEAQRVREIFAQQALGQGPPPVLRPLVRRLGLDYEGEVRRLRDPGLEFPIVAIRCPPTGLER